MFAKRSVIGLYTDEEAAASALDALREAGYDQGEYEVLTGTPYPEGTFGEEEPKHTLYRWPLIGATCGFIVALVLTSGTQLAYPLVTGGNPCYLYLRCPSSCTKAQCWEPSSSR